MTPSSAISQTSVNGPIPSIAFDKIRSRQGGECGRLVVVGRVTSHIHGTDRAFLLVLNQNAARHRCQRTADRPGSGRDEIGHGCPLPISNRFFKAAAQQCARIVPRQRSVGWFCKLLRLKRQQSLGRAASSATDENPVSVNNASILLRTRLTKPSTPEAKRCKVPIFSGASASIA